MFRLLDGEVEDLAGAIMRSNAEQFDKEASQITNYGEDPIYIASSNTKRFDLLENRMDTTYSLKGAPFAVSQTWKNTYEYNNGSMANATMGPSAASGSPASSLAKKLSLPRLAFLYLPAATLKVLSEIA